MAFFQVAESRAEVLAPSWNVAPTDPVRIILEEDGAAGRVLRTARWGLVPSWAKDVSGGARLINARSETFTEKPSFRAAAARRRCLVPADGYYEWQAGVDPLTGRATKTPFFLHGADAGPLAFAGLYELWRDRAVPEGDPASWMWSTTILTSAATDALGHIHDRTPVVLPADLWAAWLDPDATDAAHARAVVDAAPEPHLVPRQVSRAVGSVRVNHPGLVEPVAHDDAP